MNDLPVIGGVTIGCTVSRVTRNKKAAIAATVVEPKLTPVKVNFGDDWRIESICLGIEHQVTYNRVENQPKTYIEKDLEVAYEVLPNVEYFVLAVVYSTGDSFSHQDRACCEIIGLYRTYDEAATNAKKIRKHNDYETSFEARYRRDRKQNDDDLILTSSSGNEFLCAKPWLGYFESLDEIMVESVYLIGSTTNRPKRF